MNHSEATAGEQATKARWRRIAVLAAKVLGLCLAASLLLAVAAVLILNRAANARKEAAMERARAAGLPLTMEDLSLPEMPEAENAASLYEEAFALMEAADEVAEGTPEHEAFTGMGFRVFTKESRRSGRDYARSNRELLNKHLADYEEALKKIREASLRPQLRFDFDRNDLPGSLDANFLRLRGFLRAKRLLSVSSRLGVVEHDSDGAISCLQAIARMETHLAHEPMAIALMVRTAVRSALHGAVADVLDTGSKEESLAVIVAALGGPSADGHLQRALAWESVWTNYVYETMAAGDCPQVPGEVDLESMRRGLRWPWWRALMVFNHAAYLDLMSRFLPEQTIPIPAGATGPPTVSGRASLHNVIASLTVELLPTWRIRWALGCAARDLVKLGVACRRYELKKGVLPDGLEDLVAAGLLKEIPPDPCGGEAYHYVKTETGVIIYSNGGNLIDDGGAVSESPAQEGDLVLELTALPRP